MSSDSGGRPAPRAPVQAQSGIMQSGCRWSICTVALAFSSLLSAHHSRSCLQGQSGQGSGVALSGL
jgi:hypothetical protein